MNTRFRFLYDRLPPYRSHFIVIHPSGSFIIVKILSQRHGVCSFGCFCSAQSQKLDSVAQESVHAGFQHELYLLMVSLEISRKFAHFSRWESWGFKFPNQLLSFFKENAFCVNQLRVKYISGSGRCVNSAYKLLKCLLRLYSSLFLLYTVGPIWLEFGQIRHGLGSSRPDPN